MKSLDFGRRKAVERTRRVPINGSGGPAPEAHGGHHHPYMGNYTSTTKYTLITFLPKALYEQYRRVANIYFTLVAALSLTAFSPVRPWTTWTPLVIVLGISLIKEAREDYKRYKADNEVNNREVEVLDPHTKQYATKRWMDVQVGDIIITRKDEAFAADILFLTAENEEGTCYVETMNLDGETNLKIKKALDATKDFRHDTLAQLQAGIQCEPPNSRLYQFAGNLLQVGPEGEEVTMPISPAAIILRGCTLRNTERVHGVVIYAGHETKIFKNATKAPSKRSQVEKRVDKIIFLMFFILFGMCISGCIYFARWTVTTYPSMWYLDPTALDVQYNPSKPAVVGITNFITVFILYGYLIPISLYVSLEMVKVVQSMVYISRDRDMYHADTDTPALARTSNLNEELGQVNTVLSDKTGTLTRNVMEFFKASVGGVSYGAGITEIERSNAERKGITLDTKPHPEAAKFRERFFNFYDARLMGGAWTSLADAQRVEMFFRLLAVCHTVIPDGPQTPEGIKYEAESPDEAALVVAAKVMGFFFCKRTNTTVTVRETTKAGTRDVEYEVLNILEFNSTRKRMSVIVRDDTGRLLIFCKGADTVIYERLDASDPNNLQLREPTTAHMEEYGGAGLRTLCLSYAVLDPAFYEQWQVQYLEAKTSLEERDKKVAEVSELVEKKLILLGCTAIEDKLQEGVPQCIKQLAAAGIRLWVLTGDKMETAINIGFACSLLTEEMAQFVVSAYTPEMEALEAAGDAEGAAKMGYEQVGECLRKIEQEQAASQGYDQQYAMIIDGKALSYALGLELRQLFLKVGLRCAAVVCCRVSPLQKAQVTELVRDHGDVTLAIGDGANDVGMIQKAHIGVGISGQEGMQAVMSADFAIAQFRYLTPLLLVHGRYSYKRLARMINFFFFKNLLFGTTIFCYNAFAAFSGQYLYNDFYMTLFNVVFTALTPLAIGMFDRDVDKHVVYQYPQLYKQGQRNQYLSFPAIAGWLLSALYQAGVIMALVLVGCSSTAVSHSAGHPFGLWETGVLAFSIIVVVVHLQVIQITEQWTIMHHIAIWLSQLVWWFYLLAYGAFPLSLSSALFHLFTGIVATGPQYWLYLLVVPFACQLPDFFWRQARRWLSPEEHHLLQELAVKEARAAKRAEQRTVDPFVSDNAKVVLKVFDNQLHKNKGFVPPYHKDSGFYKFIAGQRSTANGRASASGSAVVPVDSTAQRSLQTAARSPVLQHLDQELAMQSKRMTMDGVRTTPTRPVPAPAGAAVPHIEEATTPQLQLQLAGTNAGLPDEKLLMDSFTSALK